MSYADTVTLLLCFFVLFFNESKLGSHEELTELETQIKEVVAENKALEVELENVKIKDETKEKRVIDLMQVVKESLSSQKIENFELSKSSQSVSIRLGEKGFFNESSFKVLPKGRTALKTIADSLKDMDELFTVHVEGHTDSKPVSPSAYYFSNLGLSSLRASNAAELLISHGVERGRVQAIGFGDSKPVAVDRVIASAGKKVKYIEENSIQNRRIEVRLVYTN